MKRKLSFLNMNNKILKKSDETVNKYLLLVMSDLQILKVFIFVALL